MDKKTRPESRYIEYEEENITEDYDKATFERFQNYQKKIVDELVFCTLDIDTIRSLNEVQEAVHDKRTESLLLSNWLVDTLYRDLIIRMSKLIENRKNKRDLLNINNYIKFIDSERKHIFHTKYHEYYIEAESGEKIYIDTDYKIDVQKIINKNAVFKISVDKQL